MTSKKTAGATMTINPALEAIIRNIHGERQIALFSMQLLQQTPMQKRKMTFHSAGSRHKCGHGFRM